MPRGRQTTQYKRPSKFGRALNYYTKGIARNAKFAGKTLGGALKGTMKSAKYFPVVGGMMNAQYKAYEKYVNNRRVVKPKEQTDTTGGQLVVSSKKFNVGKRHTPAQNAMRLVKANKQKIVFRFNGIRKYTDGQGYYFLDNNTTSVNTRNLPLNAFDITSCINQAGGAPVVASPLTGLFMNPTNGQIDFINRLGTDSDGTTTTSQWKTEEASMQNFQSLPLTKDILKWVNIRLNLYGARSKATKFRVMLVRFKDNEVVPTPSGATDYLPATAISSKRTQFYQSLLKPYVFSPIATTTNLYSKYMQVIKNEQFIINDVSTTSFDSAPMSKVINWFVRLDRVCNYVNNAVNINTGADVADQADYTVNVGQQIYPYTSPTSRLYLIVMASAWTDCANVPTTQTQPTYDISVRACHENFN